MTIARGRSMRYGDESPTNDAASGPTRWHNETTILPTFSSAG